MSGEEAMLEQTAKDGRNTTIQNRPLDGDTTTPEEPTMEGVVIESTKDAESKEKEPATEPEHKKIQLKPVKRQPKIDTPTELLDYQLRHVETQPQNITEQSDQEALPFQATENARNMITTASAEPPQPEMTAEIARKPQDETGAGTDDDRKSLKPVKREPKIETPKEKLDYNLRHVEQELRETEASEPFDYELRSVDTPTGKSRQRKEHDFDAMDKGDGAPTERKSRRQSESSSPGAKSREKKEVEEEKVEGKVKLKEKTDESKEAPQEKAARHPLEPNSDDSKQIAPTDDESTDVPTSEAEDSQKAGEEKKPKKKRRPRHQELIDEEAYEQAILNRPRFMRKRRNFTFEVATRAIVTFKLFARSMPKLSVYFNDEFLSEDAVDFMTHTERDNVTHIIYVIIDPIGMDFNGRMVIIASNEHGYDESVALIEVVREKLVREKSGRTIGKIEEEEEPPQLPGDEEETAEGKKAKKIPSALFIPKEINSLYGDRSTIVSTASIDADLASAHEEVVGEECVSPMKEPQSAKAEKKVKLPKLEKKAAEEPEPEAKDKPIEPDAKKVEEEKAKLSEADAKNKAVEDKKQAAEAEAKRKADEESKNKAAADIKKAEEEKAKSEADAKKLADDAKKKAAADAKKAEEEKKKLSEADAKQKAEEDQKRATEAEAKKKADEEAKQKAEADAQKRAEEEAKVRTEAEKQTEVKAAEKPPVEVKEAAEKPRKTKKKKERSTTLESMQSEASSVQLPKAADVLPPPPIPEIAEDMQAVEEEEAKVRRERKQRKGFASVPESEYAAVRGDDVPIECEVFNEETQVQWLVNGKPVTDARFTTFSDGYIRRLTIQKIELEDHGISIAASADGEEFQTSITVDDTIPEFVEKLERKVTCVAGKTLALSVQLSHVGQPVTWTCNGHPIPEHDAHYATRVKGTKHELHVSNCSYEDAGRYAASLNGIETSTVVEVLGKPLIKRVRRRSCHEGNFRRR
ncbi:immunoglobulin I-set domain-containing protein [Aphelenchoides avenae]|nr:immunoglobulin I-set domain-containing protein [Aphelenchus avenae]